LSSVLKQHQNRAPVICSRTCANMCWKNEDADQSSSFLNSNHAVASWLQIHMLALIHLWKVECSWYPLALLNAQDTYLRRGIARLWYREEIEPSTKLHGNTSGMEPFFTTERKQVVKYVKPYLRFKRELSLWASDKRCSIYTAKRAWIEGVLVAR
jgi:hypothetical protein